MSIFSYEYNLQTNVLNVSINMALEPTTQSGTFKIDYTTHPYGTSGVTNLLTETNVYPSSLPSRTVVVPNNMLVIPLFTRQPEGTSYTDFYLTGSYTRNRRYYNILLSD